MKRIVFGIFIFSIGIGGCIPNESEFEGFTKVQIQRLLSNNLLKNWSLTNRELNGEPVIIEACELPHVLQFRFTSSTTDRDTVLYINQVAECPEENDTIIGYWYVPTLANIYEPTDTLFTVWYEKMDTAAFLIQYINPTDLQIKTMETDSLVEQFISYEEALTSTETE